MATTLGKQGIALTTRQTRKELWQMGARWRRTARTLRHKQDPERVAQATTELTELKELRWQSGLEKRLLQTGEVGGEIVAKRVGSRRNAATSPRSDWLKVRLSMP